MDYLGTNSEKLRSAQTDPVPFNRVDHLIRVCKWLYGNKTGQLPLVRRQNPDLRHLNATLESPAGRAALESGQGLNGALDIAKGDTRILRDALINAKVILQTAKGRIVTGYVGYPDIREYARDILALARTIEEEMMRIDAEPSLTK